MRFKALYIILFLIPLIAVFKNMILAGSLAWGDAPFFYPEGLRELIAEPSAWTNRGHSFGGVNAFTFLTPLMVGYGALGMILGNNIAIRILFYFPSIIFAGLGIIFLSRYLKFSNLVTFFASLFYILNTYFILLVDGGQVGIALAYGLFPIALLFIRKLLDNPTLKSFSLALLFFVFIGIADPRVAAISLLTASLWQISEMKPRRLVYLIPLVFCWLGINMYWLFPLFKNGLSLPLLNAQTGNVAWYNPLVLFSPNWPENLFGKVLPPPVYFGMVPILIFGGLVFERGRRVLTLAVTFFVFLFFAIYNPLIYLPFGFAFRDSTKFFIPLTLIGGILIGNTVEKIQSKFKFKYFFIFVYIFLLILTKDAILGKMNFVLSSRENVSDFQRIYEGLRQDGSFYRNAWLPEKYPTSYETNLHPAIDAKDLVKLLPFAKMNGGEDAFNFLNNENFVSWFRVFGIKYLILSGNPREIAKTPEEQRNWNAITELIVKNKNLDKVSWGTEVPVYKINNIYPRFFSVEKIAAVVGSALDSLYPSVYFEDGKLDYTNLERLDEKYVALVFNGTDKTDLAMSFLQEYFLTPNQYSSNQWAVYAKDDYLKYKYELLIRGVDFNDFDYGKGIAFSTKKDEKISFPFKIEAGDYILAYRSMDTFLNEKSLKWHFEEKKLSEMESKRFDYKIENKGDLMILNVVALIPKKDFDAAIAKADVFVKHFGITDVKDLGNEALYKEVLVENVGTLEYKFSVAEDKGWVIFSDNYNDLWKLKYNSGSSNSVPIYSAINGFYVDSKWQGIEIYFKGQENVRWGIYFSAISLLCLSIGVLYHERKNS